MTAATAPTGGGTALTDRRLAEILDVQLLHGSHLHWPALDVDLCVESLDRPDAYPLTYR